MTYEQAHAAVAGRLSDAALAHSERVATTAGELASVYGVDPETARIAGVLHDWNRETPADAMVGRARDAGLTVTDVDLSVPYLLHGPLAAVELRDVFPELDAAVLNAVAAHTYGAETLTALDMVVYVADVIEPERGHKGTQELRAAVGAATLEALFAEAYSQSLRHLIDRKRRIHPSTVATWNRFIAGERR